MEDLIESLQIFLKYGNPRSPTICEHNTLYICGIDPFAISDEDEKRLGELGFVYESADETYVSYRFGSA